ncbi:MAG: sugar phosphate isomerase/epimerase, partial [SAR324 cluster bacterium]|nr:sugar phosphate isomerase/epimerase [SAR324 cluster bacterium]
MAKTIALIDDSAVMRAILRKSILMANRDVGEFVEAGNGKALELAKGLADAGVPCVAIRAGGGLCQPSVAEASRRRLESAVDVAGRIGAGIVNTALGTQPRNRTLDSGPNGAPTSHGSSQMATDDDFVRTAAVLRKVGEVAGASDVKITVEVHQHSIADNSWSTLRLLDLVDSPHVFANPDLGNIYWTYDTPEESSEAAIVALAPRSLYWHCKSLRRVNIPENQHSIFIQVP